MSRVSQQQRRGAFTLVELLVAMTVLLVLVLMMVGIANQTDKIWRTSRNRIEAFQSARNAFERLTANLNQATLNTYLDYYNSTAVNSQSRTDLLRSQEASPAGFASAAANFVPAAYDRASELQFVCGPSQEGESPLLPNNPGLRPTHAIFFASPLGHVSDPVTTGAAATNDFKTLDRVLNAVGYYVEFNNAIDPKLNLKPAFITNAPASYRYRLMELNQPSQNLAVYSSSVFQGASSWFSLAVDPGTGPPPYPPVIVIADNIVALVLHPKSANPTQTNPTPADIAPTYYYDTKGYEAATVPPNAAVAKNQLPPLLQVTLVAIDSDSAGRLASQFGTNPPTLVSADMFTNVGNNGATYSSDLNTLEQTLQVKYHLNYRVFVTDVSLPGAKWSQTESN